MEPLSETSDEKVKWIDRRDKTPLNACSLEVLQKGYNSATVNSSNSSGDHESSVSCDSSNNSNIPTHHPLIIGCYQLQENQNVEKEDEDDDEEGEVKSSSTRNGALLLHMIPSSLSTKTEKVKEASSHLKFGEATQIINTSSGVLDGKWYQRSSIPFQNNHDKYNCNSDDTCSQGYMYATACASGSIDVYNLQHNKVEDSNNSHHNSEQTYKLNLLSSSDCNNDHGLALSLAWDESIDINSPQTSNSLPNIDSSSTTTRIVSSYSKGSLAVHDIHFNYEKNETKIIETHRWNGHTLFGCAAEVWTTCFASNEHYSTYSNNIISGGDDCKMKIWDLRSCSTSGAGGKCKPIHSIGEEEYGAGVTAVTYHPSLEHIFCVGSYDESIRLWDMRKMSSEEPLSSISVGGGVWRIKWHPTNKGRILVGAMHGGCRVVDVPCLSDISNDDVIDDDCGSLYEMNIAKEFVEHESMAYGADWIHLNKQYEAAASCSFYDQQAFIWST